MSRYETGLSNMSYTSKDFNSIYSELLDLADRIAPKWKPSKSNESDPGVVLLKLDAIIGDKNNYNIDKNVLELFPSSVTQYPAAREVFDQCGYKMPYYQAAEVIVSLNLFKEPENVIASDAEQNTLQHKDSIRLYTLDNFTMLCDNESKIVYTIIDKYPFLTSDNTTYQYKALEGIIKEYNLNNSNIITYNNLDYNNRLYFKESNIAENGIFIQNIREGKEQENWPDWRLVDNLMVQPSNSPCYKFGVSKDGAKCYIEFPSDIANLIGDGLKINYITTSGYKGNITEYTLSNIFGDTITSNITLANQTRSTPSARYNTELTSELSSENIYIRNIKASLNGKDPETIEEAYKNYEKTKGTFDTLVSLRDYNNFLLTSDQVSNGFVCDRSNDIQSTSKIVTTDGYIESIHTQVTEQVAGTSTKPDINPFNLKIYALKYVYPVDNEVKFDLSFTIADSKYITNLKADIEDIKCVQHDFKDPKLEDIHHIELRYPIWAKIIPYNRLEETQRLEIQGKIVTALQEHLNAAKLQFGEEIDYDTVYDLISKCDNRIKSLILDNFDYEAYIVYLDGSGNQTALRIPDSATLDDIIEGMREEDVDPDADYPNGNGINNSTAVKLFNTIKAKSILAGNTPLLKKPEYDFKFSSIQTNHTLLTDVGKVTTNTEITANFSSNGKASIGLLENESIYLSVQNYITKDTYGNYCKYFYNIPNNTVGADSIYELQGTDYIIFFWKDSDEDASYKYKLYTKETSVNIISPNFRIPQGRTSTNRSSLSGYYDLVEKMISTLSEKPEANRTGILDNDCPTQIDGKTASDIIALCDDNTILSGTKAITIKGPNIIDFKKSKGHKLYWILNQTELDNNNNPVYTLFKQGKTTYTLKTGEYLFYSDATDSMFAMLGAGTELKYTDTTLNHSINVKVKSYEEIMYGLNNLLNDEELWYKVISDDEIEAAEMLYYNIGAKSKITFTQKDDIQYKPEKIIFDKSKCTILPPPDTATRILSPSLNDFIISYNFEGATFELPDIQVSGAEWKAYSILNLDCGPGKEQELVNTSNSSNDDTVSSRKQTIEATYKVVENADGTYSFEKYNNTSNLLPTSDNSVKIQSTYSIKALGGNDIDVSAYFLTGARKNNAFISYTELTQTGIRLSDYNLEIDLPRTDTTYSRDNIEIGIPNIDSNNNYILPILTNRDYTSASIALTRGDISAINGAELKTKGLHFYVINNNPTNPIDQLTLSIELTGQAGDSSTTSITLLPLIPYTNEAQLKLKLSQTSDIKDTKWELITILQELDKKNKYNYGHIVDSDNLIEDPLNSNSFLDTNHVYNPYTICRWDYKNSTLNITNKVK